MKETENFRDELLGKHPESDSKKPFDENRPKRLSDDDDLL